MSRSPGRGLRRRAADESGFTLVEITVAAAILLTGILGILTLLNTANGATHRTKVRDGATSLARELIEAARAVPYPDLQASTVVDELQAQPGLADTTGDSTWNIRRRGVDYTVTASVCSVDGATDGYGDHTGGSFCSDSGSTGTADTNPDDYKRVAVAVGWQDNGKQLEVRQEAAINDPGSAFAPSVIQMTPSPASPVTSGTSIAFNPVKTSSKADSVRWYLDNLEKGYATGSGTSWSFNWNLANVLDGTYQVRAQAFDRYGQTGSGYVVTIVLNRFPPAAPTGVVGGRNEQWGNLVELEWNPSSEGDVTGYEVYRVKGGTASLPNDILVCSTKVTDADATSCADPAAPSGNQQYYVVAIAPARPPQTGVEKSVIGTIVQTDTGNQPPSAPATVTATALSGGGVTLTWTASTDPDGDTIRYYRVYRDDDTAYTARYDRTDAGNTLSWTDDSATASTHTYWVSAVDSHLDESPLSPNGGIKP